ncbi:Fc receptor-like A isoform X6 [Rana temporaria]|uniref:Fc receptor-like A isoform X6 n=1 Tax=Rana temporaria TaxID=8407 RepID=UPI001AAC829D|nr:Fc receptor-like A isoform X6 [Rana temporaria]
MHVAVIMSLFLSSWVRAETTTRPMVIFTPEWNKIFTGEAITMTCDVRSMAQGVLVYTWYKDGHWLHTGKSYTIQQAQHSHSGNYQCQLGTSARSDSARLDVDNELFTPPVLRLIECDHTMLTCDTSLSPLRETTELHFAFYRDGQNVQSYSTAGTFSIPSAWMKDSGSYTCLVRTSTNEVEKTSVPLHVEAKRKDEANMDRNSNAISESSDSYEIIATAHPVTPHPVTEETNNTNNLTLILPVTLVVLLLVLVFAILIFVYRRKQIWLSVNSQQQITVLIGKTRLSLKKNMLYLRFLIYHKIYRCLSITPLHIVKCQPWRLHD